MKRQSGMLRHIQNDCLSHIEGITLIKVFNGYAFYKDHKLFGIFAYDQFFLRPTPLIERSITDKHYFDFSPKGSNKNYQTKFLQISIDLLENKHLIKTFIENIVE